MGTSSGSVDCRLLHIVSAACRLRMVGVQSCEEASSALQREVAHLRNWQEDGCSGEMSYMQRSAELLCDPTQIFPGVKSIVSFSISYFPNEYAFQPAPIGYGKVASFAWGKDYHLVLKSRLLEFLELVKKETGFEKIGFRLFCDAVPLLERALARYSGAGAIGKNTMFIGEKAGSLTFLGEILWDLDVVGTEPKAQTLTRCGNCRRCLDSCPNSALVGEGVLDARRCRSYLTCEKKGVLSKAERTCVADWLFGCDICQAVCPLNSKLEERPSIEFAEDQGVGPLLKLEELLKITGRRDFEARFRGTSLLRCGRNRLLRNAVVVAANTHCFSAIEALGHLACEDQSAIVREQSADALGDMRQDATGIDSARIDRSLAEFARRQCPP